MDLNGLKKIGNSPLKLCEVSDLKRFFLLAFLLIVFSAAVCALADEYMVFLGDDTPVGGATEYNVRAIRSLIASLQYP